MAQRNSIVDPTREQFLFDAILEALDEFKKINPGPYYLDMYSFAGPFRHELQANPNMRRSLFSRVVKHLCPYVFEIPADMIQRSRYFNENWIEDCVSAVDDGTNYVYAHINNRDGQYIAISKDRTSVMIRLAGWDKVDID